MYDLPMIPFECVFVIMIVTEVIRHAIDAIDLDGMI